MRDPLDALAGRARPGLVVASHGHTHLVEDAYGSRYRCVSRRSLEHPVTGDRVLWLPTAGRRGVIIGLEPRRNVVGRPEAGGLVRAAIANLDRLVLVVPAGTPGLESLIDRYLVAARHFEVPAVLAPNKVDLLAPEALDDLRARLSLYEGLGYPVFLTSAHQPGGATALALGLRGRTSALVGPSGAGKSSLVATLVPGAAVTVGELSRSTGLGRHTTTASTLFHLPDGGALIDSPGVRDFGLWHLPATALARGFVELNALGAECRFRDCTHRGEPGCAAEAAVAAGRVSPQRLASYRALLAETERGRG